MNRLSPAIVLVKKIHCAVPRTQFASEMIEHAAQLILNLGGVITPLILRRKGLDEYQLEHGALEYYAAVRAKEINLQQGESINAYIIDEHDENSLLAQIQMFKQNNQLVYVHSISTAQAAVESFEQKVHAFSTQLMQTMQQLLQVEIEKFKASLLNTTPSPLNTPVETSKETITPVSPEPQTLEITTIEETAPQEPAPKSTSRKSTKAKTEKATPKKVTAKETVIKTQVTDTPVANIQTEAWLMQLNQMPDKELFVLLTRNKLKKDLIETLVKTRPFESVEALKKIKGLGEATLKKIQGLFNI